MMTSIVEKLCVTMTFVLLASISVQAGITNGSFETGDLTGWDSHISEQQNHTAPATVVTSWSGSGSGVSYWEATDGDYFIVLEGQYSTHGGDYKPWRRLETEEAFAVEAGDRLVFDYFYNRAEDDFKPQAQLVRTPLTMSYESNVILAPLANVNDYAYNSGTPWMQASITFPESASYTLNFSANHAGGQWGVDNIRLLSEGTSSDQSTIPAPAAIVLGALGTSLVGWWRRRNTL